MTLHLLANIVWHSLVGPHVRFSTGANGARRYARGFSPLAAFPIAEQPDFAALAPLCEAGEQVYCAGWQGPEPSGWRIEADGVGHQMVWDGEAPADDAELPAVRLGSADVPKMMQLAAATRPGPFAERTVEMGEFYGIFEGERLVAMAGERFHAGRLREISGVCTDPGYQGRGLARRLIERLVRVQLRRGETPFLHVMKDNHPARHLYERMGFRHVQDCAVRVVSRVS